MACKKEGDALSLDLTIPANTTATVVIPSAGKITENGNDIKSVKEIKVLRSGKMKLTRLSTLVNILSGRPDIAERNRCLRLQQVG